VLLSIPSNLPASTQPCSLTGHKGFFGISEMMDAPRDQYASPPNESAARNILEQRAKKTMRILTTVART